MNKHVLCWVSCLLLAGLVGCNRSPRGGEGKETFKISGPATSTTITQGQSESVTLTIRPSRDFKEKVKVEAQALKDGLKPTLDHHDVKINGENQDLKLTVTAAANATEGKHTVRITATPEKGKATSLDVDFKIKDRAEVKFDMTGPSSTTNVAQGETKEVTVGLRPSREFNQNVKIEVKAMEKDIHCKIDHPQVKLSGSNEDVKLTVSADNNAPPGKRVVLVTATPDKGNMRQFELNFNVKGSSENRQAGFDLTGPSGTTNVKQGDSSQVTLTLKPGKDFHHSVKLVAKALEGGVKCSLGANEIKLDRDNQDVKLTVAADAAAPEGKRSVQVTATPEDGGNAKVITLNFEVKKK